MGERYMVPQEMVIVGAIVVAQYTDDHNYYRAIITAIEDLTTVKVLLQATEKLAPVLLNLLHTCGCDSGEDRLLNEQNS